MLSIQTTALISLLAGSSTLVNGLQDSSRLQIHIPKSLFKENGYEHREALFGIPPYGGSITQNVYYADSDLCDPRVDTRGGVPTRPNDESGEQLPWPSPYILMVDRGGCTFVTKVRNAQRSGAAGVIIADNTCLCSAGDACVNKGFDCEDREPIMADDGSGSDISIPSFLMFKEDADVIKDKLFDNSMVQIQMSWALPTPDDRVEYSLWTTPTEAVSRDFERQFQHAAVAYGEKAYFTPHMYIYDGRASGCVGADGEDECYNLCTNGGRYCATDPDNDLDQGISGADVVRESLRRICIWSIYGEKDGVGVEWWDYVNEFMYRCANEGFFKDNGCIKEAYEVAGIQAKKVNTCMDEAGGLDSPEENALLEKELIAKDVAGVVILPAMFVNKVPIRGGLEFATIFGAVCAGYAAGTVPSICRECELCPDQFSCVQEGSCKSLTKADAAVSTQTFSFSMLGLSAIFLVVGLIQYQKSRREVRSQVKGIIAEYMPLDVENNDMDDNLEIS